MNKLWLYVWPFGKHESELFVCVNLEIKKPSVKNYDTKWVVVTYLVQSMGIRKGWVWYLTLQMKSLTKHFCMIITKRVPEKLR